MTPQPNIDEALEGLRMEAARIGGPVGAWLMVLIREMVKTQNAITDLTADVDQLRAVNAKLRGEFETSRMLLEAAEMRCGKLDREVTRLEREVVDTSMVAEAIITAPSTPDAKIETGLLDALELVDTLARRTVLSLTEIERLRVLRRLVPS